MCRRLGGDELGVDEMGEDEMRSRRSGMTTAAAIFSSPELLGSQGELIVYPSSRRPSVRRPSSSVHHFQRSSRLKPLDWRKESGEKGCQSPC